MSIFCWLYMSSIRWLEKYSISCSQGHASRMIAGRLKNDWISVATTAFKDKRFSYLRSWIHNSTIRCSKRNVYQYLITSTLSPSSTEYQRRNSAKWNSSIALSPSKLRSCDRNLRRGDIPKIRRNAARYSKMVSQ